LPRDRWTSAAKGPIEPDGDQRSCDNGDGIDVGNLAPRIEHGDEEQARESTYERCGDDFSGDA
jgi:hypothetical protein